MKEFQFTLVTEYTDGSVIPAALLATQAYTLMIDTVNPPVKQFPVPAANVAAAVGGIVTVLFSDVGFTPVAGQAYFADVIDDVSGVNSAASNEASFIPLPKTPAAPTNFGVA